MYFMKDFAAKQVFILTYFLPLPKIFIAFYNNPMRIKTLEYEDEFNDYKRKTKQLIPFLF
jgi:hypothetical protein